VKQQGPPGRTIPPGPKRLLAALLFALSLVHGLIYAVVIPPWQIPDEPFYFASAQQEAARLGLVSHPVLVAPPASEPTPLYFVLASPVVAASKDPVISMYLLRVLSALLSASIAVLGFWTASILFEGDAVVPLATALALSLLPMVGQFSAEVAPDALANVAGALVFFGCVTLLMRGWRPGPALLVVAALALGIAAKRDALALLGPCLALPVLMTAVSQRERAAAGVTPRRRWVFPLGMASAGLLAGVAAGAEVGRAQRLWAPLAALTPSGWGRTFADLVTDRPKNLSVTFWGHWGWNAPYAVQIEPPLLAAFRLLSAVALIGLAVLVIRQWRSRAEPDGLRRLAAIGLLALGAWASALATVTYAQALPSAQSKWMFPALVPLALLAVAGLASLVPERARSGGLLASGLALAAYDAAALWHYIVPHYYRRFPAVLAGARLNIWLKMSTAQRFSSKITALARPAVVRSLALPVALQSALWVLLASVLVLEWRAAVGRRAR
jgi:hypothetical protein